MNLESIISVTGKPGLFKVISQTKNGLIVEALLDKKRMPVYASDKVSSLVDISLYTHAEDVPLTEVYQKMYDATKGKEALDHKSKPEELRSYLISVIKDLDSDRVYNSDIKKLFQWFNLLIKAGLLKPEEKEEKKNTSKKAAAASKSSKQAAKAKDTTSDKPKAASKPKAKKSAPKKTAKK